MTFLNKPVISDSNVSVRVLQSKPLKTYHLEHKFLPINSSKKNSKNSLDSEHAEFKPFSPLTQQYKFPRVAYI